jgi:FkbM family methyltransferase
MSAQHNIDNIILDTFGQGKIFVEAGGSDPEDQSNTCLLEKNNWKGLVVEPSLSYNEAYTNKRPNTIIENYALVSKNYTESTITGNFTQPMIGYVNGNFGTLIEVPCSTLDSLLKKHNLHEIHFLSLDVEGYENEVIEGIDFISTFIHCIVLENHTNYDPLAFDYIKHFGFNKVHTMYQHDYFMNKKSPYTFVNKYRKLQREQYLQNKFYFKNEFFD